MKKNKVSASTLENFDWSLYENGWKGGNHVVHNKKVPVLSSSDKIYCHESYAKDLYEAYSSGKAMNHQKDLVSGQIVVVANMKYLRDTFVSVDIYGGLSTVIDMSREKRFIHELGFSNLKEFIGHIACESNTPTNTEYKAFVVDGGISPKLSLSQAIGKRLQDEFMEQIQKPSIVYEAKVLEANNGGYFVDIKGEKAFMPGSLAAANKIIDFTSLIGKTVNVMIEAFSVEKNSFIVSFKKYVKYIVPKKQRELDVKVEYTGTVTGCMAYGIFIEFDEIFTGMLHVTKMSPVTKSLFENRQIKPGAEVKFYINELKNNRLILTEESFEDKVRRITETMGAIPEGSPLTCAITSISYSGLAVDYNGLNGVLPMETIKKHHLSTRMLEVGDKLTLVYESIGENGKVVFGLYSESSTI